MLQQYHDIRKTRDCHNKEDIFSNRVIRDIRHCPVENSEGGHSLLMILSLHICVHQFCGGLAMS